MGYGDRSVTFTRQHQNTHFPASGNRCDTGDCSRNTSKPKHKGNREVDRLSQLKCVPGNAHSSQSESQLKMFEDNEAVIKVITKGRSRTMRHMSRTHRVAIDWLFDRINLDSRTQIKYGDTKNQLADIRGVSLVSTFSNA